MGEVRTDPRSALIHYVAFAAGSNFGVMINALAGGDVRLAGQGVKAPEPRGGVSHVR